MIFYIKSSVFNSPAKTLVNTVNCLGVMGTGLALEFKLRYPEMFLEYKEKCKNNEIKIGKVDYYIDGNLKIINFPTKFDYKYGSNLKWIEDSLKDFLKTYKEYNLSSVAFPKLGCSNGGLSWEDVKGLMEKYLSKLDIDVYICLDEVSFAEGKEKEMVDSFNDIDLNILSDNVRLTKRQKDLLNNCKPLTRMKEILALDGIGEKTYSEIFTFFLNYQGNLYKQLNLF